jgi:hypothetical protein
LSKESFIIPTGKDLPKLASPSASGSNQFPLPEKIKIWRSIMEKKKSRIKIKDLNVNPKELEKMRSQVLAKIRGGQSGRFYPAQVPGARSNRLSIVGAYGLSSIACILF